ncbi:MAG: HigA family addiction module antidote protein [Bacteroidales bacterium]|nr:HigA family addiction module antidote protein [Bacteroidales bacterium]
MSRIDLSRVIPFKAVHVGEVIKDELKARGMKQSELAGLTGIQRPILNDIIKGKRSLTPEMAILVEEAMGVPAEMLMRFQTAYELDCARISERVIKQKQYLEIWKAMRGVINVKFFKKKGIIKGNIIDDVNRLFEVFNVKSLDEFLTHIEH